MIKIAQVISDLNVGGAGVLLGEVASGLGGEFEIEVIVPRGSALVNRLRADTYKITELPFSPDNRPSPADSSLFRDYFRKTKPDIVHTHAVLNGRIGAMAAGVRRKLSTRHCAKSNNGVKKGRAAERLLYSMITDTTVSTADFATDNLIRWGIPKSKIVTIKNGVKERRVTERGERAALKESLGIAEDGIVLGSAARLERVKGQDLMIWALRELLPKYKNLYLLLVGEGGCLEDYKSLAARLGVLPRVKFTGYKEDPTPYQNIFDINLNASRGTETSCLATSECMSLSIPTVASDFGGNPELIFPMINGLLFKSDNCHSLAKSLDRLLQDRSLIKKLGEGARSAYLEKFSVGRMLQDYKKLYLSQM